MDTATEDYAAGIDPDVPLFQSGPTLTQLRSGTSGWSIRPDLIPGYLGHVNSAEVSVEVGRLLANERWGLAASFAASRVFRSDRPTPNFGTPGSAWPEGVAPAAWARHTTAVDLALRDADIAANAERVAVSAEARLCVRCRQVDGQVVADVERVLFGRPAPLASRQWCRPCALVEVAAALASAHESDPLRVRAGASV